MSMGDGSTGDETPMPVVKRVCKRCPITPRELERGYVLVSPNGTAHSAGWKEGLTDCGLDATGDGWLWPL